MAVVGLVRASPQTVRNRLEHLLDLLGAPLDAVRPGDLVLLKPNMFQLKPGFRTSPDLLAALAAAAADRGARVVVGERTRAIHRLLADTDVGRYAEITSFDDRPLRIVQIEQATSLRVPIAVPDLVLDCDYFIGVPHLRTHSSMVLTGAMKNLIGLLPGYTTRVVHMAGVDESVVDLNLLRPQHLVVADLLTVIEGNYPMAGSVREVGLLAGGTDAVAVDTLLAEVAGVRPDELAYLCDARERGVGGGPLEVRGERPAEVAFRIERAPASASGLPRVQVHADTACPACRRWVAAAVAELREELAAYPGEVTIVAGPRERLPELRGAVVLVGNALYDHREAGVYLEGCPPRAIQLAGIRYAIGQSVEPDRRTQFRVPGQRARRVPAGPVELAEDV